MAKSYRTANIRVTEENNTKQEGLVTYTFDYVCNVLEEWSATAGITYWAIPHNADEEVSKTHYHMVIKFKSPVHFETIKNKFPYGDIESSRNLKASVQYLIHFNDKSKEQYAWEQIKTNCKDMTPYKVQSISQQEVTIQGIMESINSGKIREYNQFTEIPIELWARNRTRIENALLYFRERICMDKDRSINVIFISGAAGLGKTTFAKNYADTLHKSYCISSSSNDPLQDYKGEDVLILDDLREDSFKFHDFIKLLDNHTMSSSKSRYHNKAFIGDTIIITSVKPLQDWYHFEKGEEKHQLYRRIQMMYKFTQEKIYAFDYDHVTSRYEPVCSTANYITMKAREKAKMAMSVLDAMGLELNPVDKEIIQRGIENSTDEELEAMEKELERKEEQLNEAKKAIKAEKEKAAKSVLGSRTSTRTVSGYKTKSKRTKKEAPNQ